MKILYISNYLEQSGYSEAARNYILALDSVGIDVVCRPLYLTGKTHEPNQKLKELQDKSLSGCTHVIQHTLPNYMSFNGNLRNIGLYASETDSFRDSVWASRLNTMDEVWVINEQMKDAAIKSGVKRKISVVPHTLQIEKFQREYKLLKGLQKYKDEEKFIFYFIGEPTRRKNLAAILKAFHTEFDVSEPVELLIKTSGQFEDAEKFCNDLKAGLKLNRTKDEIIVTEQLTDEEMMSLHAHCDCLVAPSYGEAWSIPAFEAMAHGRTPIVTGWGGPCDFLSNKEGWMVHYMLEPAFGMNDSFQDLYTGNELWASIDIPHLKECMRECYSNAGLRKEKSLNGIARAYDFSYENVGNLMKGILNESQCKQSDQGL